MNNYQSEIGGRSRRKLGIRRLELGMGRKGKLGESDRHYFFP
jgi:hypothetical protein